MEKILQTSNDQFETSLIEVAENLKNTMVANRTDSLTKFIQEVNKLKTSVKSFSNMVEDFLIELEEMERQKWEIQEVENEYDYQQSFPRGIYNGYNQ